MKKLIFMILSALMFSNLAYADLGSGYYLLQCEHNVTDIETGQIVFTAPTSDVLTKDTVEKSKNALVVPHSFGSNVGFVTSDKTQFQFITEILKRRSKKEPLSITISIKEVHIYESQRLKLGGKILDINGETFYSDIVSRDSFNKNLYASGSSQSSKLHAESECKLSLKTAELDISK